jgi:hypothetical protein
MSNLDTAERGIQATTEMIERLGGRDLRLHKEGNKRFITFVSPGGKQFKVTTRAKKSATWQTTTTYGKPCLENHLENQYWVFVDLEFDPPKFYPVPLWWILNNIYEVHEEYLKRYGGHRKRNDNSNHHAVQLERIKSWESRWKNMDL